MQTREHSKHGSSFCTTTTRPSECTAEFQFVRERPMDVVQVGVSRHRRQNITRSRRPRHGPKSLDLPGVRGRRSNSISGARVVSQAAQQYRKEEAAWHRRLGDDRHRELGADAHGDVIHLDLGGEVRCGTTSTPGRPS